VLFFHLHHCLGLGKGVDLPKHYVQYKNNGLIIPHCHMFYVLMCFMFSSTLDPPFPCCPLMTLWHPLKSLAIRHLLNILCCFFSVTAIPYCDHVALVIVPFFGIFILDWGILLSPVVLPWPHLDTPSLSSITFNVC